MKFKCTCPQTGGSFTSVIEINGQVVARYWGRSIQLWCPQCGSVHSYDFKERYINAAMELGYIDDVPTSTL